MVISCGFSLGGDIDGNETRSTVSSEINHGIRNEVQRLSERWSTLLYKSEMWQRRLDNGLPVGSNQYDTIAIIIR